MKRYSTLVLILLFSVMFTVCISNIDSAHRGVWYSSFSGTDTSSVAGEGTKLHAPWTDAIEYSTRTQSQLEKMTVLDSNGLDIDVEVSVLYRPIPERLPHIHLQYGPKYYDQIIKPQLRSVTREEVGKYTSEQLYTVGREKLQDGIFDEMKRKLDTDNIVITDVLIRDVGLPSRIREAIKTKLEEEQEAARYEYTLEKEKLEAERKKIEAQGQAEYQRILASTLTDELLQYEGIKATLKLANSENSKIVVVGSGENGLPMILGNQ